MNIIKISPQLIIQKYVINSQCSSIFEYKVFIQKITTFFSCFLRIIPMTRIYHTSDSADLQSVPSKGLKETQTTTTKSSGLLVSFL